MPVHVTSEIGRLRRVLVHRPGKEIDWMVPAMMEELLFDDILYGEQARAEHDEFCLVLRRAGVETLFAEELLAEVLVSDEARSELGGILDTYYGLGPHECAYLESLEPERLARVLVGGVRAGTVPGARRSRRYYDLSPLPNYFFQRDPQIVIGERVAISSMATEAREREPLLARMLFGHHPELQAETFEIDRPHHGAPEVDRHAQVPNLEGGDVLVASPETVLVGLSERTNRRGVEVLAEHLRSATEFKTLLLVELPAKRSYMHLDTVLTFVDRGACLAFPPLFGSGPGSAHVYRVDLEADELAFTLCPSIEGALAQAGQEVELIPCGGADLIDQEREQWTDGANAFAIAPGVITLYRRNRKTVDELARRGFRVVSGEEVARGDLPVLGEGPTVVTVRSNELSRARGGPHCMTMPLQRDDPEAS